MLTDTRFLVASHFQRPATIDSIRIAASTLDLVRTSDAEIGVLDRSWSYQADCPLHCEHVILTNGLRRIFDCQSIPGIQEGREPFGTQTVAAKVRLVLSGRRGWPRGSQ